MSIDAAIAIVWDVLKMGFAPIKRGFGYVMSSQSYANNLQQEVRNLEYEAQRVRSAEGVARANLQNIHEWVPNFLASAEEASTEARDLLDIFEGASKTCCRGTIPDPNCRYQFSRKAKSKTDDIQKLILENKDKEISFGDPAPDNVAARYADELRKEVKNLEYEAARVHNAAKEATNNLRNTHEWVKKFLASAEAALREARGLLGEFEEASKTCCRGTLPDPNCLDQLSRKAKRMTDDIKNLILENSNKEISFSGPARREGNDATASVLSASMSVKLGDPGVFESRASMIRNIMDALAGNSMSVFGVHGMGGVGKSTLLEDAEKRIRAQNSFDWVARADVSENPDIKRIQGEIAHWLRLTDLEKQDNVSLRATLLRERLEKDEREKKKVLIILDNLWEKLDLKLVGIPCGHNNKAIGCKLLLTSRYERVLRREMRCDSAFRLGVVEEEEAERLFETMVGGKVEIELEPLVKEALGICAGLPFLIVAISKLFIGTTYPACKCALTQIWSKDTGETGELINKTLQISYDRIKSEEAKSLLQLIAVYGVSKPSLENLLRYGFGLGLFEEESSMEDARNMLSLLIEDLQDSSLLLHSEEGDGFKIHDLVREFVALIISKDRPLLVLKNESLAKLSQDKLQSCRAICFPYVDMKKLPEELVCPELRIFLVFANYRSLEIPNSYFNFMRKLEVLNLTGIRLNCLPSPFQFLKKLHALCLDGCSIDNVASLGELKGLQILSLQNSNIQQLPKEIGQLVELRLLDLNGCSQLRKIEPGVLGSLIKLEELYMENSFDQWNAVEQTPPTNASLSELNDMKNLHTLHVSIPNPSVLPGDLNVKNLTKYEIKIGHLRPFLSSYELLRTLELQWGLSYKRSSTLVLVLGPTSDVLQKGYIRSILGKADRLFLVGMHGNDQSICALSQVGFPKLKYLQVMNSPSVRYILQSPSHTDFKTLESLLLKNLINLEKICCSRTLYSKSFSTLKVVRVEDCNKMEVLFPRSVMRELPQLEELQAVNCKLMRGIVEADDDRGKFELPKLRVLELRALPNAKNFITAGSSPSSSTSDDQVGTQIAFFNGQQVAFPSLETLEVYGLDNLGFMFSPSMVKSLAQLRKLKIRDCKKMEAIITEEEGLGVEILETLSFPMLTDLSLTRLESLTCFSREKCSEEGRSRDCAQSRSSVLFNREVAFPSLETLEVSGLDNVGFMFSPSMVKSLAQLRRLSVSNCDTMEAIITEEEGLGVEISETLSFPMLTHLHLAFLKSLTHFSNSSRETQSPDYVKSRCSALFSQEVAFPSLETLKVDGLDNIGFMFSPSMVKSLARLRKLEVIFCEKMEAIITEEEGLGVEITETLSFPMLTDLSLEYLESLTCFSREKCSQEGQSQDCIQSRSSVLFNREVSFPFLDSLRIEELPNLKEIWSDESPLESSNLRSLKVVQCESLSKVISSRSLAKLHKLETLSINDCSLVQEIFNLEGPSANGDVETLSELTTLELNKLGSLRRIWNENPSGIVSFHKLKEFKLDGYDNLEFIFFPSMVKSLPQLKALTVSNCKKMETIIAEEEGLGMEISKTLAFSMLTNLRLDRLKSLKCFSRRKCSLEAESQGRVNSHSAALFSGEVALPSLETLSITDMDNIEMIWDNQVVAESFPKLKSLFVERCNKLVTVVPPFVLGRLKSLESLMVEACGSLEVVFGLQPLIPLDGHPVALPLKHLTVSGLPKLKCVWDKELHQVKFQRLQSVSISECNSLTSLFPASVTRDLIQLEELVICECGIAELIEKEEALLFPRFDFPKLTSLKLKDLTELKHIYTGTHTSHWPALKTLTVDGCNKVEILASQNENEIPRHKQPLFLIEKGAFPNLQEFKLDLCERMEIWHGDFHDEEFFCKLRVLKFRHLSKGSATSTSRFIESLTNLEELVVCESYLEEPSSNVEAMEGPSQEQKVILPFSRQIKHLMALNVSNCDGLSSMFTPTIAENLVALTKLRISNCRILTEVLHDEEGEERREVAFSQLKCMELDGMIELTCFSPGRCVLRFPLLEDVIVNGCPNMKFFSEGPIEAPKLERVKVDTVEFWKENLNMTIQNTFKEMVTKAKFVRLFEFPELVGKWHNEHNPVNSSWQLKALVVDECPFINAMPSKLMLVLEKMTSLHVRDCKSLEEIFDLEGLEPVESTRVLPRLEDLRLINLPKLRQLWNKDLQGTMRFNSLYSLTLYKCSNLRHAFTPSMAWCLANIYRMEIRECDQMEGVIEEEEGHGSVVEKISFPRLGRMTLKWLPNLTSFLSGKNHALDCPKIEYLRIAHCPKMRSLTWRSSMDINHNTPSLFTPQVQFPRLAHMALSHMDNLCKIWTDNPLETLTFDSLWVVKVKNCQSLENLFPHWVATSLTQLEKLRVESCRIEEIIANGDDTPHSNIAQVLFSKLTSLVLHEMPGLKNFCHNLPTLNWPFLKELRVTHCDKVNMLSFAASMNKWTQRNDQQDLLDQEAHSSFERDFPNLEGLLLVHKDIEMIQDGKYPDDIFGKSKALTMACFHEEKAVFPSRFLLERFQNLESLEVFCSSFEDIFPDKAFVDEKRNSVLESLRVLKLSKLCKLKRVWREDCLMSKILRSIKTLEVWDCPELTILFPAVTSFRNLTELVVSNSSGLVHLGTASAVASLVHLTEMTVIGCERMKEVVAKDENRERQDISFEKLEYLRLQNMPSLECFSSTTSCNLRFPSLWEIVVEECPKMNIFSKGTALSTPMLGWGTLFGYDWERIWKWEGDLNRAIQKLSP